MSSSESSPVSRGPLIALGVVVGLVALFALYSFVISPLLSGDEELAEPTVAPSSSASDGVPGALGDGSEEPGLEVPGLGDEGGAGATPTATPSVGETPAQQVAEIFEARDPFQQLVVEPVSDDTTGDTGADGSATEPTDGGTLGGTPTETASPGSTSDGSNNGSNNGSNGSNNGSSATPTPIPTVPSTANPTSSASPGSTASPAPPSDAEVGTTRVTLDDVFTDDDGRDAVLVTVNGSSYQVNEGETFATSFRVLDISPPCSTFLFGDSRFTLCEGERIRK